MLRLTKEPNLKPNPRINIKTSSKLTVLIFLTALTPKNQIHPKKAWPFATQWVRKEMLHLNGLSMCKRQVSRSSFPNLDQELFSTLPLGLVASCLLVIVQNPCLTLQMLMDQQQSHVSDLVNYWIYCFLRPLKGRIWMLQFKKFQDFYTANKDLYH